MRAFALFLPLLLASCADRAEEGRAVDLTERLNDRIETLERRVETLEGRLDDLSEQTGDADRVADLAGARTCALDLARTLEAFRTDNARYPRASEVTFPPSCTDLRVDWTRLTGGAYAFDVQDQRGRVLTRQRSQ